CAHATPLTIKMRVSKTYLHIAGAGGRIVVLGCIQYIGSDAAMIAEQLRLSYCQPPDRPVLPEQR
ncbi:MAG TPA: hypothetical protein VK064_00955, partial [Wenzhouxiangella sp.]|nr:hypothetical protein [Wenzhouxiangella sp.]